MAREPSAPAVSGGAAAQPDVPAPDSPSAANPVFAFLLFGTPLTGALNLWVSLANELHARGFGVHAWWTFERLKGSGLHPAIPQRMLFHVARYSRVALPRGMRDGIGRTVSTIVPFGWRHRWFLDRPGAVRWLMDGLVRRICDGVDEDRPLARRLARGLGRAGVTHVLPMLAELGPWALAARRLAGRRFGVLAMFQGYELTANYARPAGLEGRFYERLRQCVQQSDWPAVAVSEAYRRRVIAEIGVPPSRVSVIPCGIRPLAAPPREEAVRRVAAALPNYRPGVPLLTYLGRRDAEKGIDLLLYAAALLRSRGIEVQVAVCGHTLHGGFYAEACRHIAENLRLDVHWHDYVGADLRAALFVASDVVVYPSIWGEPFGMVSVEAMSCGTPVVVPDSGGVRESIEAGGLAGGLTFRSLDSGHLADVLGRILTEPGLRERLRAAAPRVAAAYSLDAMTDRFLRHMGLPLRRAT